MLDSFIIALVQGVSEFLPISSSAHLITARSLLGLAQTALLMDIAAHAGTLLAALVYFRGEMTDCLRGLSPHANPRDRHLLWLAFIASVPVVAIGAVLFATGWIDHLRTIEVVAWTNLLFALLLFVADKSPQRQGDFRSMGMRGAFGVGLLQACALVPGASRAGSVITAMRFLGYERGQAARFALFLALPALGGAVALGFGALESAENLTQAALVALLSFLIALGVLQGFIRFSQRFSLLGFVIYRLVLSGLLFVIILS